MTTKDELLQSYHENLQPSDATRRAAAMSAPDLENLPEGHPIRGLRAENEAMNTLIERLLEENEFHEPPASFLPAILRLNGVRTHYAKKEEILMPMLYRYGVTGPSDVMWREDDEIKKELGVLTQTFKEEPDNILLYRGRIRGLLQHMQAMTKKEDLILFPLCLRYFNDDEWYAVYEDAITIGTAFLTGEPEVWELAEAWKAGQAERLRISEIEEGKVRFEGGALTVRELRAILKLVGVDITFIDTDDMLRFFENEGRVFARPKSALGNAVYDCHPPQVVPAVRQLIADFRAKKRDHMTVWRMIAGKPVSVRYHAVYDRDGKYLGTVEFVQDCTDILAHFKK